MEKQFEIFRKTRAFLLNHISGLTTEQLNRIPAGFNNNIVWNLGHMVAAQQGISYLRNGLPMKTDDAFFQRYKPESKPAEPVTEEEIETIRNLFITTIDQLEEEYNGGMFNDFKPWANRYGVEVTKMEESITFLLFHDGLHLGYIMALKHAV